MSFGKIKSFQNSYIHRCLMALTCFPLCKFIHCLYICIYVNFESHTLNFVTSLCYIYITDIYVCMYVCLSSHLSANVRYFLTGCTSSSHVYKFKTNHIDYIYILCHDKYAYQCDNGNDSEVFR